MTGQRPFDGLDVVETEGFGMGWLDRCADRVTTTPPREDKASHEDFRREGRHERSIRSSHAAAEEVPLVATHAPRVVAVGLATSFVAMFLINGLVLMTAPIPIRAVAIAYGFVFIAVGLGSGVVATLALAYKHERSALVWPALLPGALMAFVVVGELVAAAFGVTHSWKNDGLCTALHTAQHGSRVGGGRAGRAVPGAPSAYPRRASRRRCRCGSGEVP